MGKSRDAIIVDINNGMGYKELIIKHKDHYLVKRVCIEHNVKTPYLTHYARKLRRQQIADDIKEGMSLTAAAMKYGLTSRTIELACIEHGVMVRRHKYRGLELLKLIIDNPGMSAEALASIYHVTHQRVSALKREAETCGLLKKRLFKTRQSNKHRHWSRDLYHHQPKDVITIEYLIQEHKLLSAQQDYLKQKIVELENRITKDVVSQYGQDKAITARNRNMSNYPDYLEICDIVNYQDATI